MHMMTDLYDNGALCSTLIGLIGPTRCYIMYDDRYNTTVDRAAVPLVILLCVEWGGAGVWLCVHVCARIGTHRCLNAHDKTELQNSL